MLKNLFAPLAMKVFGGIIAALLVALTITMWRADTISGQRDEAREALALETVKHAITLQSLDTLTTDLEAMIIAGKATRENVASAMKAREAEAAALRSEADRVRNAVVKRCETPDAVLGAGL